VIKYYYLKKDIFNNVKFHTQKKGFGLFLIIKSHSPYIP
jgi:hypothetical protein